MLELYKGSEFLEPVSDSTSFALVSYRQMPEGEHGFTMDEPMLKAVLERAAAAEVTALWLDAWCFRFSGEYDHIEFCALLSSVVSRASAVVWLPTSRVGATATYQFRLWCTFEASVVEQRKLPVYIAGDRPTHSQRLLALYGVHFFHIIGAGPCYGPPFPELTGLSRWNNARLFGLLSVLCMPVLLPVVLIAFNTRSVAEASPWLGRQHALARNGQRVLQIMLKAAGMPIEPHGWCGWCLSRGAQWLEGCLQRCGLRCAWRRPPKAEDADTLDLATLCLELPWLPAYDRRDALVIAEVLKSFVAIRRSTRRSASLRSPSALRSPTVPRGPVDAVGNAMGQVATSLAVGVTFGAVQLETGSADEALEGPASPSWSHVASEGFPRALAFSVYVAALIWPSSGDAPGERALSVWLAEKGHRLHGGDATLSELAQFGWSLRSGDTCLVRTPLGDLLVRQPATPWRWGLQGARPLPELPGKYLQDVAPLLCWIAFMVSMTGVSWSAVLAFMRFHRSIETEYEERIQLALAAWCFCFALSYLMLHVSDHMLPALLFIRRFRCTPHYFGEAHAALPGRDYSLAGLTVHVVIMLFLAVIAIPLVALLVWSRTGSVETHLCGADKWPDDIRLFVASAYSVLAVNIVCTCLSAATMFWHLWFRPGALNINVLHECWRKRSANDVKIGF